VNVCTVKPGTVTLVDGTIVASDSEAWRAECEARRVLSMRNKMQRNSYIYVVEHGSERNGVRRRGRGKEAADKLRADVMRVWRLSRHSGDVK
jgi:hypothetical protein